MRLACSTRTFYRDRPDMALARISWAGFEAAELGVDPAALPDASLLRTRLRGDRLELVAVHAGELAAAPVEPEELAPVGRAAALARELDCGVVVVAAPVEGSIPAFRDNLARLRSALGETAVDLAVVNRAGSLLDSPERLRELWAPGPPAGVAIALDPAQALLAGWDPVRLDLLPAPPRCVYLTDARDGRPCPPGEGELDVEGLSAAVRTSAPEAPVILVLENADPWRVEPQARELRLLMEVWFE